MKFIKLCMVAVFIALVIGMEIESVPFEYKIIMFGAIFVIAAMLLGGVLVAVVMDGWEALEKDRRHGP